MTTKNTKEDKRTERSYVTSALAYLRTQPSHAFVFFVVIGFLCGSGTVTEAGRETPTASH